MKVLTVVGARPQFMKAAPVSRALSVVCGVQEVLVHTGQHHDPDMSDVFFAQLALPQPHRHLGINGGGHGQMTGRMLEALESVLFEERPDVVLVYGDTNSTLAAALAAAKSSVPVAHVEAGLRSFDRDMPEEVNRVVVDHVSSFLFSPTRASVANLSREGLTRGVHHVGDVMYDAVLAMGNGLDAGAYAPLPLGVADGGFHLATLHRASTTGSRAALSQALGYLKGRSHELPVVLPLHPRTRACIAEWELSTEGLTILEPLGPFQMHSLLSRCASVLTDSGGLQKEAYFHGKPCVTLRESTEWVETIEAGWNRLWTEPLYRPRKPIDDYGQGDAAKKIVAQLCAQLGPYA